MENTIETRMEKATNQIKEKITQAKKECEAEKTALFLLTGRSETGERQILKRNIQYLEGKICGYTSALAIFGWVA